MALVIKNPPASAEDIRDAGLTPELGRSPGGRHGRGREKRNPLQYSCLENPMDRGAWWATVHGVAKSWTWLKQLSMHTRVDELGSLIINVINEKTSPQDMVIVIFIMCTIYVSCAEQSVKFCVQYVISPFPHLSLDPFPFFPLFLPSLLPLSPSLHSILSFLLLFLSAVLWQSSALILLYLRGN